MLVATSRVMSTNSVMLTDGTEAFVIDPAWMPDELDALAEEISVRGLRVLGGFATHAHHDHLLWHPRWGAAPRWASDVTAQLASSERDALVASLGTEFPPELVELMGRVRGVGAGIPSDSLPAGVDVEIIVHDGHAPGHTALWIEPARVLVAGDMLSDVELPLPFDPDDLPSYTAALDILAPYAAAAEVVVPGHGSVGVDARERLEADRRYIDDMVRTGASTDQRIGNPGMDDAHARMRELASR